VQLFVANKEQPAEITSILRANRSKLLRFLKDLTTVEKGKFAARTITSPHACTQLTRILHVPRRWTNLNPLLNSDDKKFEADKATVISEILALVGAEKQ
jgi:calcium binding protein 39